jgi:DNA mismatch endonuclease (patch repair protein)
VSRTDATEPSRATVEFQRQRSVPNGPVAASDAVSARMSAQRSANTAAEMALRKRLFARGLRYRVHRRPIADLRREADIVFVSAKVAVFVDGCFWHGCPIHGTNPKSNGEWWATKLQRNRERDFETNQLLAEAGWMVVRVWEHEPPDEAAINIAEVVALGLGVLPGKRPRAPIGSARGD